MASSAAAGLLRRQLKQMQNDKDLPGISCGLVDDNNVFEWEVMLMINDDCKFYGGTAARRYTRSGKGVANRLSQVASSKRVSSSRANILSCPRR